jgi:hypothetical protein
MRHKFGLFGWAALLCALVCGASAQAQQQVWANVVAVCGTPNSTPVAGAPYQLTIDIMGKLCISASGGGGGGAITAPLGHATADTAAVSVVPSATALFPVIGPTAAGSASTHPPVQIGGTVDGTATGLMATATVKAANTPSVAGDTGVVSDIRPNCGACTLPGPSAVSAAVPFVLASQYPANNITTVPQPFETANSGTTAAVVATMPALASKTSFICGFTITSNATTALGTGIATIAGPTTSLTYIASIAAVASGVGVTTDHFNPCIPATTTNTAITVTAPAAGTGGVTNVVMTGYYL